LLLAHVVARGIPAKFSVRTSPGLSHIALYVQDMEKSRAFYKDFLGFAEALFTDQQRWQPASDLD